MASDPFAFPSASPSLSASAAPSSSQSSLTPLLSPPSTPRWSALLPHILVIVVISAIVFCCCNCLGSPSRGRISRRRSDVEPRFSLRARRRRGAAAVLSKIFRFNEEEPAGKNSECCVCLNDFKNGDLCRMVSACGHNFHQPCIDHWLKIRTRCPLCRVWVRRARRADRSETDEPAELPV